MATSGFFVATLLALFTWGATEPGAAASWEACTAATAAVAAIAATRCERGVSSIASERAETAAAATTAREGGEALHCNLDPGQHVSVAERGE